MCAALSLTTSAAGKGPSALPAPGTDRRECDCIPVGRSAVPGEWWLVLLPADLTDANLHLARFSIKASHGTDLLGWFLAAGYVRSSGQLGEQRSIP